MEEISFSQRLTKERKRLGFDKALHFSDEVGLNASTYSRWEAGQSKPKTDDLATMVAAGVDVHYLLTGSHSAQGCAPDGAVRIRVMEDEPSAGHGAVAEGHAMVRGFLDVQQDWASQVLGARIPDIRLMIPRGDSMAPTICSGDLVFVDTGVRHFDGEGIYVFDFMGSLLIKRLRVDMVRQLVLVCSDNNGDYPTQEVSQGDLDQLHICGRVHTWLNVRRG